MDNGLYYHDTDLANGAEDNSYRYAGANPNNYVCFGDDCSVEDNLCRIIGVFGNEVKLIKADYTTTAMTGTGGDYYGAYSYSTSYYKGSMNTSNVASYYWNSSGSNTWSASALNTTNLNSSYLSYIGSTWSNKIATHSWKVGGASYDNVYNGTARTAYNYEVGNNSSSTTYSAKIGLMYASDYGFAVSNSYWTSTLGSYNNTNLRNNNWMYMGLHEWTISRTSDDLNDAFLVTYFGNVGYDYVDYYFAVRPSFYLKENVTYISGDGSKENPIQIDYKQTLADYVISQYTGVDGDNGLYYHDADLANGAGDNSYRYAGANPNNYVCFGSDEETCPEDNLYRIIGVFGDEVKLIKSTSFGSYQWDSGESNTWDTTTKPDIYTTLNSTYYNTLETTWQNKIATHAFKVGGMDWNYLYTAKNYYDREVGNSSSSTTDSMKIGLMYVSDYGFAANNSYWTEALYDYDNEELKKENWIYLGDGHELTISRYSDNSSDNFNLYSSGEIRTDLTTFWRITRPVFYLNSNITYVSGSGTSSDPIILS